MLPRCQTRCHADRTAGRQDGRTAGRDGRAYFVAWQDLTTWRHAVIVRIAVLRDGRASDADARSKGYPSRARPQDARRPSRASRPATRLRGNDRNRHARTLLPRVRSMEIQTTMTTEATITPKMIAARLTHVLGKTVSPKQVRGRVRGDAGTPLLSRFGEGKAPYASHLYSVAEANEIGQAFVKSSNGRSGLSVKWPAWNSVKPVSKRSKPSSKPTGTRTVKRASIGNRPATVAGKPVTATVATDAAE
jgi:hypothetical protein